MSQTESPYQKYLSETQIHLHLCDVCLGEYACLGKTCKKTYDKTCPECQREADAVSEGMRCDLAE